MRVLRAAGRRRRAGGAVRRAAAAAAAGAGPPRRASPRRRREALGSALALRAGIRRRAVRGRRGGAEPAQPRRRGPARSPSSSTTRTCSTRRRRRRCASRPDGSPPTRSSSCSRRATSRRWCARPGCPELVVGGPGGGRRGGAGGRARPPALGRGAVAAARRRPAGNPLALLELTDEGFDALPPGAPVPVPASLARTFARRADALSGRHPHRAARRRGGRRRPRDRRGRLRAARGVRRRPRRGGARAGCSPSTPTRIAFRHDLVRSGVYAEAAPAARRAVHAALAAGGARRRRRPARLAPRRGRPPPRTRPSPRVLDEAAARARARGAWAVASAGYERAARLTPDPADRAQRLVSAAESAWRAGLPDAAPRPARPRVRAPPVARRCAPGPPRSTVPSPRGPGRSSGPGTCSSPPGTRAADEDPDTAVMLLADAILACQFAGDVATARRPRPRSSPSSSRGPRRARWVGSMATAVARHPRRARRPGPAARRRSAEVDAFLDDPQLAPWLVVVPLYLRESAVGRDVIPTVVAHSRRRSDIGGLPILLFYVARDQATTDRWDDAVAGYTEGDPAGPRGRPGHRPHRVPRRAVLARGAAGRRGRLPGARRGGAGARRRAPPRLLPDLGDDRPGRARARPRPRRTPRSTGTAQLDAAADGPRPRRRRPLPRRGDGRGDGAPGAGRRGERPRAAR